MIAERPRGTRESRGGGRQLTEAMLERRRQINRESMRRRRAERAKSLQAEKRHPTDTTGERSPVIGRGSAEVASTTRRCAICRARKSVEEVIRLLPSTKSRSGYVQVRIPYCGCC
jgi:hypothetical protein